jgi:hypothetical protein
MVEQKTEGSCRPPATGHRPPLPRPAGGAHGGPAQLAGRRGRLLHRPARGSGAAALGAGEHSGAAALGSRCEGEGVKNEIRVFTPPLCSLYLRRGAPQPSDQPDGPDQGGASMALLGRIQVLARSLVCGPRAHLSFAPN